MNSKVEKEVFSAKVPVETKEWVSNLSTYLNLSVGKVIEKAIENYSNTSGYTNSLKEKCKKHGFFVEDVIHESVRDESKKMLENLDFYLQEFYEEYLYAEEELEEFGANEITLDLIDRFDYVMEWEEFIGERIKDTVLQRIDTESNRILNISSTLLFASIPNLKEILEVEVAVQIYLFNPSYPTSVARDLELLVTTSDGFENRPFKFDHWQLSKLYDTFDENEILWFYTFTHLVGREFRGRAVSIDKARDYYKGIFTNPQYTIFKMVKVEKMIKKIIETPKVEPFSIDFSIN